MGTKPKDCVLTPGSGSFRVISNLAPITILAHTKVHLIKYTYLKVPDEPLTMHIHQEDMIHSKYGIVLHGVDNVRRL